MLYISGCTAAYNMEGNVHHGEAILKNGFDYSDAKTPLQTAEFRLAQMSILRGRKQALSHLYKFFRQKKPFKNSFEIYGTGANDAGLNEGYEQLTKIKNSLIKCGHSHNIAAIYDDLGDVAGCMGRYEESLSHYTNMCEYVYASLYSNFKAYTNIYSTYYRMAKIYKLIGNNSQAHRHAMLALRGIMQNDRLLHDHLDYIWNRKTSGKQSSTLGVIFRTILDRSVTIEFKLLHTENKKLFEEIKQFRDDLY
jgi:tetratricopeptide (TPR) repeat protein